MTSPRVIIPKDIYDKVMCWVIEAKGREISGLGKCDYDAKNNTFKVVHASVLEQSIQTSGNTEITAEASGKYMYETRDIGQIVWWWHSHHSMGAFWSGTDDDCIRSFDNVVATVFNNKYEHLSAVRFKATTSFGESEIFHKSIKADVVTYYETEVWEQWRKEYEAASLKYVPSTSPYHSWKDNMTDRDRQITFRRQPPKKMARKWAKVPDKEKYIFEEPEKWGDEWVWTEATKDWSIATDADWNTKDLLEHPAWKSWQNLPKTSESDLVTNFEDEEDGLPLNVKEDIKEDNIRSLSGFSQQEWQLLTPQEREFYYERFDGQEDYPEKETLYNFNGY